MSFQYIRSDVADFARNPAGVKEGILSIPQRKQKNAPENRSVVWLFDLEERDA